MGCADRPRRVPRRLDPVRVRAAASLARRRHPPPRQRERGRDERLAGLRAVAGAPGRLLDVLKGLVPAALGLRLGGDWVGVLAGAAAMLGHARPVFLGFSKGGKMVATAGGVALALAPFAALGCGAIWLVVFALTRYASLSSMVAAMALPLCCRSRSARRGRWSGSPRSPRSPSSRCTARTSADCSQARNRALRAALPRGRRR